MTKKKGAPVKARALEAAVPVLQPATLKDSAVVSDIAAWHADIGWLRICAIGCCR